jgi:glycerol-3-phosphate dehydrogenase
MNGGALPADRVDLLVAGGGIHGAGALQAAAAAGLSALLVEERAPAWGTSSRSSKLIHGGLRYLESGHLGLVRESLAERAILLRIAPELVRLVPFHIPVYRGMARRPWMIRAGLSLYALLGGLSRDARFESLPREAWATLDGLEVTGLQAVFRYRDGQTDDAALVRAVLRSAVELGARVACPASFVAARRTADGWIAKIHAEGVERELACRALVNAAGPWVDGVQARIEPEPPRPAVDLVQGTHLELAGAIERGVYYAESPRDRRGVFAMPWKGHTLLGTTEVPYSGPPEDVKPLPGEVDYLLDTFRRYFPGRPTEVLASWSGLRVLPHSLERPSDRPREVQLVTDDPRAPRLVAIYGGKLTAYRSTAQKVLRLLRRTLPAAKPRADTARLPLGPDRERAVTGGLESP